MQRGLLRSVSIIILFYQFQIYSKLAILTTGLTSEGIELVIAIVFIFLSVFENFIDV